MKVSIITATIGKQQLAQCIESVRAQTYKNVEHIIVVDGKDNWQKTEPILYACEFPSNNTNEHIVLLPFATGKDRFNGHRIYGASTFLASGDFFIWLDDDNFIDPNHVESLVETVEKNKLDWAYSLRKIVDDKGNYICLDDCENLGKWKSILNDNFVDVNCFFIKRELAIQLAPIWYRKAREPNVMEVDRALTAILMHNSDKLKFDTNNEYTVNYRVGSTDISVRKEFFLQGNDAMLNRYDGKLPWKK
jgi:glycosyltransferase involved in cell wall biosynthesis